MFEPGTGLVVGGKYELEVLLGRGGMGSVWAAEHMGLGSRVAVKFMSPELVDLPSARARFEREAKSAARISSPHVVRVHDHGVEDGLPFIVMELLEGEDLGTRMRRDGAMPLPEAKRIVFQIAKGLSRAHERGIVHRDLKPANVFLCTRDDDMVKILDFGVARAMHTRSTEVTQTGALLGSPQYMSPEQARGRKVDSRSDVWSLAVVAYRMVTGERPFLGTDVGDVIVRLSVDPHTPATQNRPTLHPDVNTFFDRALAKDKADRFQNATDLATAFSGLPLAGEPARSGPTRSEHAATLPTLTRAHPHSSAVIAADEAARLGSISGASSVDSLVPPRQGTGRMGLAAVVALGAAAVVAAVVGARWISPAKTADAPTAATAVATPALASSTTPPPDQPTPSAVPVALTLTASAVASAPTQPHRAPPLSAIPTTPSVSSSSPIAPQKDRELFRERK